MIAVDTSALMAILLDEPEADDCMVAIQEAGGLLISAGTMAELIDGLGFEIVPLSAASARRIAAVYGCWGKGIHPAALNLGDCFAYDVAAERNCRLLYVGSDFSRTDVRPVL